jgi:hypothetical protein
VFLGGFLDVKGAVLPGVLCLDDLYFRAKNFLQEKLFVVHLDEFKVRCDHLVIQRCIDIVECDSDVIGYTYVYDEC